MAWYLDHQPEDDEADPLDRDFLIRYHADRIDPPSSPGLAAGLPTDHQHGQWYLIRADEDLLSEFLPEFSDRGFVPLPPEDTTSTLADRAAARDWWVSHLIDLFSVLLNPARFDDRGVYVPAAHLATTLGALNLSEPASAATSSDDASPASPHSTPWKACTT